MVSRYGAGPDSLELLLLAEAAGGQKLPPPARAAVLMALLGIALLGMLLVAVVLLGGNWVRRQGNYRRGPSVPRDRTPLIREPDAADGDQPRRQARESPQDGAGDAQDTQADFGETRA
ncbi:MAG: hypothetical protein IT424_13370 [Pirellulales bacterium]|nr:hypothetical protein [Pirellulales bacterium]